ncbi:MAG: Threonine efflux protein [Syntrophorhabdus sp. PtaB.Bin047]|jgi:RhtB (resistance to homoserine/threonine) family protein|nr:MAG: Threonine efflux protein [Syntrophorhabdus sp. PtaB.Bin047]
MLENLAIIGTIAFVHLLGAMSPGPDLAMSVRNSLTYSRRTGIFTAVGFGLGVAVHVGYCIAGIAVVIARSILVFGTIKYLGAAYLLYIGIRSVLTRQRPMETDGVTKKEDIPPLTAVRMGFLTNILNPKATLFFLGLFTVVISPAAPPPRSILIIAGFVMVVDTMLWFSFVAVFLNERHVRSFFGRFQGYFNKAFGVLLILLSIRIAFLRD